ncbi:MAG: hypothetical protein LQ351_001701 [Letrouitia transgressa]|nr:MAG: hypothetical protein LQ351_001701 [Letrouitia transgressa]
MAIIQDFPPRGLSNRPTSAKCLEDRFEILKDIGDGSFGSVALARVRTAGSQIARRGTLVAIKTMKKTFESFTPCLELREIIFLRSLPTHAHLVPALDIFLDPLSKKLHICMEYMDGNLYQLMKTRDHRSLEATTVKSILYQILGGLEHIHAYNFFHRDIKPENILVSASAPIENTTFRRYSALMTPPNTPQLYTIKIADFGLARETHSQHPYTTYVSTRWYRAPEVLLRAGEYSAPVDIWAIGAMAVEIANLKPLFPGGNEVDQVWRVCEIMGSPGNWYDRSGNSVGGGDWREGTRLAQKLGFSFPKMAPHSMETILRPPQWPASLSSFVTWCLMWDPCNRPTSAQAMNHEYFIDAIDPLRPKSSATRFLGRKQSNPDPKSLKDASDGHQLTSKPSWFRKSLIGRESSPPVPVSTTVTQIVSPRPSPIHASTTTTHTDGAQHPTPKPRPFANKRATWTNGATPAIGAPMPILPSIRPISPFSDAVTAQAHPSCVGASTATTVAAEKSTKKIGRQLSVASNGNHYADHRQEAERALNGNRDIASPSNQKEGFFSHLRKRARRLSGRPQAPVSPTIDDVEASVGCGPWQSNRGSMVIDSTTTIDPIGRKDFNPSELEKALQSPRPVIDPITTSNAGYLYRTGQANSTSTTHPLPERHHSLSKARMAENCVPSATLPSISSRTRRALQQTTNPSQMYETPDEEDELLHEALYSASKASKRMDKIERTNASNYRPAVIHKDVNNRSSYDLAEQATPINPYPTPSPSAKRSGAFLSQNLMAEPATPIKINRTRPSEDVVSKWPTPPPEENEWAAAAAASIFAAGSRYQ